MYPLLFHAIPSYFVMWAFAAVVGVAVGAWMAARAGFPTQTSAIAIALLAASILAGSKVLYLAEAHWFPFDDYVPLEIRSSLHGFRIPGGMLALALMMPLVSESLHLTWRRFGDAVIPLAAVALVFIRVGCFLNGCCFGRVSRVPWAVAFPRGSWVYAYHRAHGLVPSEADRSLPVHPLQLYFVLAAVLTWGALLWHRRASPYPGHQQLVFYALFFGTTAALEPLRENYLTLNHWLAPIATAIACGVLLGRSLARHEADSRSAPALR